MDATDSIDPASPAQPTDETGGDRDAAPADEARRRMRIHAGPAGLSVASHLAPNEPVTEAEIRLILALLGDTIIPLLKPKAPQCPAPPSPDDA